jgi:hypothetical protein
MRAPRLATTHIKRHVPFRHLVEQFDVVDGINVDVNSGESALSILTNWNKSKTYFPLQMRYVSLFWNGAVFCHSAVPGVPLTVGVISPSEKFAELS